jgi:hypothetical protein
VGGRGAYAGTTVSALRRRCVAASQPRVRTPRST